jgi:hypothetical protein
MGKYPIFNGTDAFRNPGDDPFKGNFGDLLKKGEMKINE